MPKQPAMPASKSSHLSHKEWTIPLFPYKIALFVVLLLLMVLFIRSFSTTACDCSIQTANGPPEYSYTLVQKSDAIGEDLMQVQARDLKDVKMVCDSLPNCAGYNSNGWLKTKVTGHITGTADLYVKSGIVSSATIVQSPVMNSKTSSSYEEMLTTMKIYIYEVSTGARISRLYSHDIERGILDMISSSRLRTRRPEEATFFFIPVRCSYFFHRSPSEEKGILKAKEHLTETLEIIKKTYPYWERTAGSDHVYVCAHRIGAGMGGTLLKNSVALVYSADYDSPYFVPHRDIALPPYPTHLSSFNSDGKRNDLASSPRSVLAFFAGDVTSGRIRPTLYSLYGSDHSIVIFSQDVSWKVRLKYLSQSKFCLIVRGEDVWSSQLVDAIMASCVPVIISDHYHLPLQGVVHWEEFSLIISESQISSLKDVLIRVSIAKHRSLQDKLRMVQRHFIWNEIPKPYDAFYSVMFELWQRRDVVRYRRK